MTGLKFLEYWRRPRIPNALLMQVGRSWHLEGETKKTKKRTGPKYLGHRHCPRISDVLLMWAQDGWALEKMEKMEQMKRRKTGPKYLVNWNHP